MSKQVSSQRQTTPTAVNNFFLKNPGLIPIKISGERKKKMKRKWDGFGDLPLYKRAKHNKMEDYLSTRFLNVSTSDLSVSQKILQRNEPPETIEFSGQHSRSDAMNVRAEKFVGCAMFGKQEIASFQRKETYWKYLLTKYESIARAENFRKSSYHEVMLGPSKLVIDVDMKKSSEDFTRDHRTSIDCLRSLTGAICRELKADFGIECSWPKVSGRTSGVIVLDGSRREKLSFHVVFSRAIFENTVQAGCYLCKVLASCPEATMKLFRKILPAIDFNIYSEGHNLRTYYSVNPFDLPSRLLLYGPNEQKFSKDVLLESLATHTHEGRLKCILVENVKSLSNSKHYRAAKMAMSNSIPKEVGGARRPSLGHEDSSKVIMDLMALGFKQDFFDVIEKLAQNEDSAFTHEETTIRKCYLSTFGSKPIQLRNGSTVVNGPSFCMEVSGPYCLRHKKRHKKAKIKTYYYFPYSDEAYLRSILGERFSTTRVHPKRIYRMYYRCNYREANATCVRLEINTDSEQIVEMFAEFHKKLMEHLRECENDWMK